MIPWMLSLLLFSPQAYSASCKPEDIILRTCKFFYDNPTVKEFKTSEGAIVKNPAFQLPVDPNAKTQELSAGYGYGASFSAEAMGQIADNEILFQIEVENLLKKTKVGRWPLRNQKFLHSSFAIGNLLAELNPDDELFDFNRNGFSMPYPFGKVGAPVKVYSSTEIQQLALELGPHNIEKLKQAHMQLTEKNEKLGKGQPSQPAPVLVQTAAPELSTQNLPDSLTNKNRQTKLFNYAKDKLKEMIIRGRKVSDLTEADQNLLSRLDSVELGDPKLLGDRLLACAQEAPNAAFHPISNKVYLCPGILRMSDAMLAQVIGHELGHSIDPCGSSCEHFKVNPSVVNQFVENEENKKNKDLFETAEVIKNTQAKYSNMPPVMKRSGVFQELMDQGMIQPLKPILKPEEHPLKNINKCLIDKENFDDISDVEIEAKVQTMVSQAKRANQKVSATEMEAAIQELKSVASCHGIGSKVSEMNEVMSDVGGAYVLSSYLKDNPPKTEIDAIASSGLWFENTCGMDLAPKGNPLLTIHPTGLRRLNGVVLNFPGVLKNFPGCDSSSPTSSCFTAFEYLNQKQKPMTTEGVQK